MKRVRPLLMTLYAMLTALSLLAALTCLGVLRLSRDGAAYLGGFTRFADTSVSGVGREDYPALAAQLAAYFNKQAASPQVIVQRNGSPAPAYGEKELMHLAEVLDLFDTLQSAQNILWGCTAVFAAFLLLTGRHTDEKTGCRAVFYGLLLALLTLLGIALWAYADFYSFFYRLHQALFRSRLWLLDPQTDLLIQLMPESFFVHLAKRAALYPAPAIASIFTGMIFTGMRLIRFHATGKRK